MSLEPQSIVHQVIRLQRRVSGSITGSIERRYKKKRPSRRNSCDGNSVISGYSNSCYSSGGESLSTGENSRKLESGTFNDSFAASSLESSLEEGHPNLIEEEKEEAPIAEELCNLTVTVPKPHYGDYRTINQNEFFLECMIKGEGSAIIHFFDENSSYSQELDEILEGMAQKFTACKFLRIDGAWTQFVASKLMITKFPTILAIRNKVILDRLSDFDTMDFFNEQCLEEWIVRSIPLINGQ
jgi:hypothetical protein